MSTSEQQDIAKAGLDAFAPYLMNRIIRRYNDSTQDTMTTVGLTVPKMRALSSLAAKGALTINELAVYAVSEQSTMSRLVDQLDREGLVRRKQSDTDHRVRVVTLTSKGRKTYEDMWPHLAREQDKLLRTLSEDERALFLALLRKVLHTVRRNPL